jgi:dienelactone hydrolase
MEKLECLLSPFKNGCPNWRRAKSYDHGNVEGLFFESLAGPGGASSETFAYIGMPRGAGDLAESVPGIVLVHGGGGSAFAEWVELWNERGYAAIAVDLEGQVPIRDEDGRWRRHARGGPSRKGVFEDIDLPLREQWMTHALAGVLAARSLLASRGIRSERIGLTGISWGAVVAAVAAGMQPDFAFAAYVYGCGYLSDSSGAISSGWTERKRQWDPARYIENASMPVLWVNGDGDSHFSLDCTTRTHSTAGTRSSLTIIPGLGHSHRHGWSPAEIGVFADSIVLGGEKPPSVSSAEIILLHSETSVEYDAAGDLYALRVRTDRPIMEAEWWSSDEAIRYDNVDRTRCLNKWTKTPVPEATGRREWVTPFPQGKAAYLNMKDARGCITSIGLMRPPR